MQVDHPHVLRPLEVRVAFFALSRSLEMHLVTYSGQRAEFWLENGNSAQYSITEPERDNFSARALPTLASGG